MNFPNFSPDQYIDADSLNAASADVSGSVASLASGGFLPGLVSPSAMTLTPSGFALTVGLPSPFAVIFSTGVLAQAHGTTNGSDTQSYTVNFSGFVPSSGTATAYLAASYQQIQQTPLAITGPPPGHPDFNPFFTPYTAYQNNVDSLAIAATSGAPNNLTTFELARYTIAAGATGLPAPSTAFQAWSVPKTTSSNRSGVGLFGVYVYPGDPNGNLAGTAGVAGVSPPDICWDTANNLLWTCTTTGTSGSAVWTSEVLNSFSGINGISYAVDTGTANAIQITLNPVPSSYTALTGRRIGILKSASVNTAAVTIAVSGVSGSPPPVLQPNGLAMSPGELPGNGVLEVVFASGAFELQSITNLTPRVLTFAGNPNGNLPGQASSGPIPPDLCWDTTDNVLWTCTTTGTSSTAVWTTPTQQNAGGAVAGPNSAVRLSGVVTVSGATTVTFTADTLTVAAELGGQAFTLANFSETIDVSLTGAGGMDVGSTVPSPGFLAIYAIYNPITGATNLLGTAVGETTIYSGGNMPAGYTSAKYPNGVSSLVAVWPTNSSGHLIPGSVVDRWFYYTSPTPHGALNAGTALSQTPVPLASFVPQAARSVNMTGAVIETSTINGSSTAEFQPVSPSTSSFVIAVASTVNLTSYAYFTFPLIVPQTVYYFSGQSSAESFLNVNGYEL